MPESEDTTMVNKVRLTVAGSPYVISTTDSEEYVLKLAKKLDDDINNVMADNPSLTVTRAAVFCALEYLDDYTKSIGSADNMRSQIKDYLADAAKAKLATDEARREVARLQKELQALRERTGG